MPYMDWEVHRRRAVVSKTIAAETERFWHRANQRALDERLQNMKRRINLGGNGKRITHSSADEVLLRPKSHSRVPSLADKEDASRAARGRFRITETGRVLVASRLGQYLMDAARLYEAMNTLQDRLMIEKYLHMNPPLHPRRTLNQFQHRGMKTTTVRDRNQVLYRGTRSAPGFRHRLVSTPTAKVSPSKARGLLKWGGLSAEEKTPKGEGEEPEIQPTKLAWTDHCSYTDTHGCEFCANDIKLTPKLIMVDQLWMWILDKQTVITAFPGRYQDGYVEHLHGLHKSIRERLGMVEIRSIFDIALVVLDKCSTTFFNRNEIDVRGPTTLFYSES